MRCENCGSEWVKITMFDGPTGGGHIIVCDKCGRVKESRHYCKGDKTNTEWMV